MATRRSIPREERDQRIYSLAASGLTQRQIAQQLGVSKTTVHKAIQAQAQQHKEESLAYALEMILKRGQLIVTAHMKKVADPRSADVILRASEQQAKLLGLYTPQQGSGTAEAASMIAQLIQRDEARPHDSREEG